MRSQVIMTSHYAFFCQKIHDSKGRDCLNEVETINTGIKICDAVKRSDSDILKVRLFNMPR